MNRPIDLLRTKDNTICPIHNILKIKQHHYVESDSCNHDSCYLPYCTKFYTLKYYCKLCND